MRQDRTLGIDEGDRIIADFDPATGRDRGVVSLEAQQTSRSFAPSIGVEESTQGVELGTFGEFDGELAIERFPTSDDGVRVGDVGGFTVTERRDLDPVGIGRDRNSGRFTPDNTEPAPRSPSNRNPDDGEFVTPDPRPITDIGRQRRDGLFDLF